MFLLDLSIVRFIRLRKKNRNTHFFFVKFTMQSYDKKSKKISFMGFN